MAPLAAGRRDGARGVVVAMRLVYWTCRGMTFEPYACSYFSRKRGRVYVYFTWL